MCSSMNEFYEIANFMNTWSQQEQELHESFVNRLYECKPVKSATEVKYKKLISTLVKKLSYPLEDSWSPVKAVSPLWSLDIFSHLDSNFTL